MQIDVLIVGGGIFGTLLARELARRGVRVALYRVRDRPLPTAESLYNQAWFQSGLHYFKLGVSVARAFHDAKYLFQRRFRIPSGRGVMRIGPRHRDLFLAVAEELGIQAEVRAIGGRPAERMMGRFYRPPGADTYFTVPDAPFPEAQIIQIAREQARRKGALLRELDAPIRLEEHAGTISALIGEQRVTASRIVLACGCGTPRLLMSLGVDPRLKLVRTPLLVLKEQLTARSGLRTPLLVDRTASYNAEPIAFAITKPLAGRMVFGVRQSTPVALDDPEPRKQTKAEEQKLLEAFEAVTGLQASRGRRFAGGLEISSADATDTDEVLPVIRRVPDFTNLWWALPGRATMAMSLVETMLDEFENDGLVNLAATPHEPQGSSWEDLVEMFCSDSYDPSEEEE